MLKAITGEDPFSPEYKNSNATPAAKPINAGVLISCNSRLKIHLEGDRGAWERRLIVIPFDRESVPEEQQVSGLSDEIIREEGSGVLNWMLEGLKLFLLDDCKLFLDDRQRRVVSDLLSESESTNCYMRECVIRDQHSVVTSQQAYKTYVNFCATREWPPLSERRFNRDFKTGVQNAFGITQRNDLPGLGQCSRGWSGIQLTDHGDQGHMLCGND